MPVVPTEENRVGIAGVTGEKLVPGDFSGSGLDALGAGMQSLGQAGQKVAVAQHQQAIEDDAAVKKAWNNYAEQSRTIRAGFYARQGSDAASALKPATDALRETVDGLRDGLRGKRQRGIFDRSVPERLIADVAKMDDHVAAQNVVDQQKQSLGVQGNARGDAVENAGDPEQFQRHVDTGIETMRTRALLQGRDPASVNHEAAHFLSSIHRDVADGLTAHDALAAHQYLRDKAGEMIAPHRDEVARSLAPVLGEAQAVADVDMRDALRSPTAPVTPPGDIAAVTGRMLTVESARQADGGGVRAAAVSPGPVNEKDNVAGSDAPGRGANAARTAELAALMRHYRGDAAKAWAASLQGQAGVDALVANHGDAWFGALPEDARKAVTANMTLLGAATSPRTPPTPEDHASTSSWIQAQDWKDDRKQLAHEELHKRVGLANRQRSAAQDAAKETGLALARTLGPGFISVNQLPPAVRRDLPDDALAALTLRADRNVHPVTVAPHGDVATKLNRMAATDPEGFAKVDLRLEQDRMSPGEYSSLEDTQKGMASYPPAPATVTQRNLWDEIRRNGLDDGATPGAGAVPPSPDEAQVDHLANVASIPEALRGTAAIKGTVREMLRRDWTPDQIQNQLYEAYARRSLDLSSGYHPGEVGILPGGGNRDEIVPEAQFRNIASGPDGQITFDPNGRPVVGSDGASPSDAILKSLFPTPQPVKKRVPSNQLDYGDFSTLWEAERKKGVKLPKFVPAEAWKKFAPDADKMHPETDARPYERITLHHTGSEDTPEAVEILHGHESRLHKIGRMINSPGNQEDYDTYGDVGYHFLIGRDGTIYEGRSLAYQGAHVMDQNERNIGIAILGDYSRQPLNSAQIRSVKYLIMELNRAYHVSTNAGGLPYVFTHRELAPSGKFARPDELVGAQKQTDEIEAWSRRFLPPLAKDHEWVLQALPPARKGR